MTDLDPEAATRGRSFVHLANSMVWRQVTGTEPPTTPMTAAEYAEAGLPWFEYYSEKPVVKGGGRLGGLKSVAEMAREKGEPVVVGNESVTAERIVALRAGLRAGQVREGSI